MMEKSISEDGQNNEILEAIRRLIRSAGIDPEPLNLHIAAQQDGYLLTFDPHPLDIRSDVGLKGSVLLDERAVELTLQAKEYVPMQLVEQDGKVKVWVSGQGMPSGLTPEIENILSLNEEAAQNARAAFSC